MAAQRKLTALAEPEAEAGVSTRGPVSAAVVPGRGHDPASAEDSDGSGWSGASADFGDSPGLGDPADSSRPGPSEDASPTTTARARTWAAFTRRKPIWATAAALAAAAVFAGWSGYSWYSASHSTSTTYGETRDEALTAGRTLIATLNTLDYHQVDAGLSRWLDASTGPLHDELARTTPQTKQALATGATVATGKVLDAGLSELDAHAGTAKLIASVEVTVAKEGAAPATRRNRYAATLTRTESGWKLSTLDQLAVTAR